MSRHHGFTWVEMLVVIAIIGTLMAFLLPATQSARQVARNAEFLFQEKLSFDEIEEVQLEPVESKSLSRNRSVRMERSKGDEAEGPTRKIVYKASINLVVEDFSQAESGLRELVEQYGGFLADARIDRRQGSQLTGKWQARIPVDQFTEFCQEIVGLGLAEQQQQTAQDVTEEFVDLEARIANKRRLEERIVSLLEKSSGNFKAIIEIERELARVREEIESMQGRLRFLTDHTALTTISISIREEQDYVPPKAPSYTENITNAWHDSLASVLAFGQRTTISLVYVFPWLMISGVLLVPPTWLFRRVRRRTSDIIDKNVSAE